VGKYLTKIEHGYRHSKGFTLQDFHEPIQIKESSLRVVRQNCLRCHQELVSEITNHQNGEPNELNCIACHASVAHGPTR
jgi:cytochrome c nitrite reductase small subunit